MKVSSILAAAALYVSFSASVFGSCSSPANAIEAENCLQGSPQSEWGVSGSGDPTIQGFATDISVNVGQSVFFKINTTASAYTISIYRLGYYDGDGARLIDTISPSAQLPQSQPACLSDSSTGLVDCGNWAISASWRVPANAVSGVYFARLVRSDTAGASQIVFVVRNDSSGSDVVFQTADESWQAYNPYGGHSLYGGLNAFDLTDRAYKVSYNRPFNTLNLENESWVMYAEYPMIRWLEANGYDLSYVSSVDVARTGSLLLNHKIYLSVGHDEYWSGPKRSNVEAARDAGVNLAFFSGNEVFWKTRWENSIDGSGTPYRTLVCYKETLGPSSNHAAVGAVDPFDPPTWTGTWRDPSKSPPADGHRPENALTGQLFRVNGPGQDNFALAIKVPAADGKMRFWRNTRIAAQSAGQTWTLPAGTLGYEWDAEEDNGSRPAGLFDLSAATYTLTTDYLQDYGGFYGAGTATHRMSLYRAPSGALVFGAGTVQWSWGLDNNHDGSGSTPDVNMQQATVNLFADMGVQPTTIQPGLIRAAKSSDAVAPKSTISWPTDGTEIAGGSAVTISGSAADTGGGVVGGVEVSTDGGISWHPASGRENWTYTWRPPSLGNFTLESRAVDDSGNLESASSASSVVTVNPPDCPCQNWSATTTPSQVDSGDPTGGEFGVRFRADFDGYVTGVRFYKASKNTGIHIGHLWTNSGTLLATATFTNETASGWQQVTFSNPVLVRANTTYVASYFTPSGHYSDTGAYFLTGSDAPPLHFLRDGVDGANGVYSYSAISTFPTSSYNASNYWVDVVYIPAGSMPGAPPALLLYPNSLTFTAFQPGSNPVPQTISVYNEGSGPLNWSASSNSSWLVISPTAGSAPSSLSVSVNVSGLAAGTYTGTITVSSADASNPPQTITVTLLVRNILLSSNFSDGRSQGWVLSPLSSSSTWSVVNQLLQYNGSSDAQIYAGNSAWADYSLDVSVKLSTLGNWPGGIRARTSPQTGAGYAVWMYPAQGSLVLYRTSAWDINQGLVTLGTAGVQFDTANFHHLVLTLQGSQIQVAYDGVTVITASDVTYASGVVAIEGDTQAISVNSVVVTSVNSYPSSLTASTGSLSFSGNYQGANPTPQNLQLTSTGGALAWTATTDAQWLSVSPAFGYPPATVQVAANLGSLPPGSYSGTITLVSLASYPPVIESLSVNLTVVAPPPLLVVSPGSLNFVGIKRQTVGSQSIGVTNGGYGSIGFSTSSDSAWLTSVPANGSTPQNVTVSADIANLSPGSYSGHVSIASTATGNSPQVIPVSLEVLQQDLTETFADQASGWMISPLGLASGWTTSNGAYSYAGLGLSQSCAGNGAWSDYTFDTTIQLQNMSNWPGGVRGRVNPLTGAGYAAWLYPATGTLILYRVPQWSIDGAGITELARAQVSIDTASHDLGLNFRGNLISVTWDGALVASANDAAYASGIVCMDADSQPVSYSNVRVAAVQNQVTLDPINPSSLIFNATPGSNSVPQSLSITAGGASTTWAATSNVPWLSLNSSSMLTPATLTATASASGLAPGSYTGTVTVWAPGASNSPLSVAVTLAVKTAVLVSNPTSLMFFGASGLNPTPQTIRITNGGAGTLNWSATANSSWLGLSPAFGNAPGSLAVSPDASSLGTGTFTDSITIASPDAGNDQISVPVSMQVGSLLFADSFSNGAGSWTISPSGNAGGWSVVNGTYAYSGGGATQAFAGNPAWTDYSVAADFRLSTLNDYPGGIRGRVNTTTGASYGVWIYPAEGILRLYRIGQWNIDADLSLLGASSHVGLDTAWHNLRLVFQGTSIQVYYDNQLEISATDSSYAQGAVALDVSNQPITFDNVSVISMP